jgi:hypothetical protein
MAGFEVTLYGRIWVTPKDGGLLGWIAAGEATPALPKLARV